MKKLISLALAFMMCILSVSLFACSNKPEPNPVTDFEYAYSEEYGGIAITKYIGTSKSIVFPEEIDGKPVKIIGRYLLEKASLIESVVISDTVEVIVDSAFGFCTNLVSVDFGKGVREIGYEAFRECKALKKIILPPKLETIGAGAFYGCASAEEIFIPKTLKNWKTDLSWVFFGECDSLKTLTFEEGIETIGNYGAFTSTTLEKVVFPSSLKQLDHTAFNQCPSLKTVVFLGDAPEVGSGYVFGLYEVPENLTIYYNPTTKGWDETPLKYYTLEPLPQN